MQTEIAKTVPIDLESSLFKNFSEEFILAEESYSPLIDENRDSAGRISSISYYNCDKELEKQIFYEGSNVSSIKYYSNNKLIMQKNYENTLLISKDVYNKYGRLIYSNYYEYGIYEKLISIKKCINGREVCIKYNYDSLDRIISRKIFLDDEICSFQEYSYDVLNNITRFKDDNQEIIVIKNDNNKLISYSITDRIGNVLYITNRFVKSVYVGTEIVSNGQKNSIKDFSYVDNVMLKKPRANEDDLDLIVSKLLSKNVLSLCNTDKTKTAEMHAQDIIDENIKIKTLPISIRKRILYNISMKSNS